MSETPTRSEAVAAGRWPWPAELDAVVAAPANHHLLLENDRVRVIETVIPVNGRTPVHTHRWPSVEYVVSGTNFVRRDGEGNVVLDTRDAHSAPRALDVRWLGPLPPHSVENVGDTDLCVIMVELKDHR